MKLNPFPNLWLSVFLLHSALCTLPSPAATNDLSGLLQQGLFEEEANRDLKAAIAAYESLTQAFDQDQRLAATAVFRLGECYRKLGQTNEAAASYQRILRDFPEEETLATLSRQNLVGMGVRPINVITFPRPLPPPDTLDFQQRLTEILAKAGVETNEFVERMRETLARAGTGTNDLVQQMQSLPGRTLRTEVDDEEDQEIRRLQAMIQNSPDLINLATGEEQLSPLGQAARAGQMRVAEFLLENGAKINAPNGGKGKRWDNWPALFMAADSGHKAMVELLLSRGVTVDMVSSDGNTALLLAADKGFQAVAEVLLANGADPTAALHRTAESGHAAIVELLLAKGADMDAKLGGSIALILACEHRHSATAQALLAAGANPAPEDTSGRTALSYAAERCDLETVEALLAAKADPNAGTLNLPLQVAAYRSPEAFVEALLKAGADPNRAAPAKLPTGTSSAYQFGSMVLPLYLAIYSGRPEVVQMLLDHGANPNGTQPDGTPLIFQTLTCGSDIVKLLLEAGAMPNVQNRDGSYPLNWIAGQTVTDAAGVTKALLAHGANPDAAPEGYTPLIAAIAQLNTLDVAAALLESGADVNRASQDGQAALHLAVRKRDPAEVSLLLRYKADVNARGPQCFTPLHYAVQAGIAEIVQALLNAGADPNLRNDAGQTPLDLAKGTPPGVELSPGRPPSFTERLRPIISPASPQSQTAVGGDLTTLLREHGALDELPDWNTIRITRPGWETPEIVFKANTNGWNQFTLLEALAYGYRTSHERRGFPDLSCIVIHRPAGKLGEDSEYLVVNLLNETNGIACDKDVPLKFGDLIDVPIREHALNEKSTGLSRAELDGIDACVMRRVQLIVRETSTEVTVFPWAYLHATISGENAQSLLLSSSDLSRVKVTRTDPKTGKTTEFIVDVAAKLDPFADLWLRGGDVIEVPEKE